MDINALNKVNIDNLTGLWEKMGLQQPSLFAIEELRASASWPNRCWFDWDVDTNHIPELETDIAKLSQKEIIPVWRGPGKNPGLLEQLLKKNGFRVSFEQTAMYLESASYSTAGVQAEHVEMIGSPQEIETWTAVASESFGYKIDTAVIRKVAVDRDVQLLQIRNEGQVAATAMLYRTADVIGVHQVGVAKKHQGKGIATTLMQHIISASNGWTGRYIVLQASAEARSLYSRLGFKQQFMIRNYQLFE